jgi:hypothetical protein
VKTGLLAHHPVGTGAIKGASQMGGPLCGGFQ